MCVLAAATMVTGCSALGSSSGSTDSTANGPMMKLKVGANPVASSAAVYIAQDQGLFAKENLKVTISNTTGGAVAVPAMIGGSFDITTTNDSTAIAADVKGTPLKFVVDGVSATPGTFTVDTLQSSGILTIKELAGKTIGVSSPNDPTVLALKDEMKAHDVDPGTVKFVAVPFINMEQALKNHTVDAAIEIDPYKTQTAMDTGARPVVDVFGSTSGFANFPITAFVTTAKFASSHQKEITAFQKAMVAAATMAVNPAIVKSAILHHTKITETIASVMTLPTYPADLDPKRLSRVVYLLKEANLVQPDFQIESMILPLPPAS